MKNKTSYQKLKYENEALRKDIYNLVMKRNEEDGCLTDIKWYTIFSVERALMQGDYYNNGKLTDLMK